MASGAADDGVTQLSDDGGPSVQQQLEDAADRLLTLSDKMTLCTKIINDLKDLRGVLVRKSLQDVSLPLQK